MLESKTKYHKGFANEFDRIEIVLLFCNNDILSYDINWQ